VAKGKFPLRDVIKSFEALEAKHENLTLQILFDWKEHWLPRVTNADQAGLLTFYSIQKGNLKAKSETTIISTGGGNVSIDKKTLGDGAIDASQRAAGDMIGVAGGVGNTNTLTVTAFNSTVDAENINGDLKSALKECRSGLENAQIDRETKDSLIECLDKIAKQVSKPNPVVGIIKAGLGALSGFGSLIGAGYDKLADVLSGLYLEPPASK
jgi:hypothetical protein